MAGNEHRQRVTKHLMDVVREVTAIRASSLDRRLKCDVHRQT